MTASPVPTIEVTRGDNGAKVIKVDGTTAWQLLRVLADHIDNHPRPGRRMVALYDGIIKASGETRESLKETLGEG